MIDKAIGHVPGVAFGSLIAVAIGGMIQPSTFGVTLVCLGVSFVLSLVVCTLVLK